MGISVIKPLGWVTGKREGGRLTGGGVVVVVAMSSLKFNGDDGSTTYTL